MGQLRRSDPESAASGLPRGTDFVEACRHVANVPRGDMHELGMLREREREAAN
jgi:hypothetical protein